jgi:casein kinase II subunit alpha
MADFKRCILKPAKQVGRDRIEREIKILHSLKGGTNIMIMYDIVRDGQVRQFVMILRYVEALYTK